MGKLILLVTAVCIGLCAAALADDDIAGEREASMSQNNNGYDRPLNVNCGRMQAVKRIRSSYSSGHRDRRFLVYCASYGSGSKCSDCSTTPQYVNDYRKPINFNCPANQVLTGVQSVHHNSPEDRRWKFRCCRTFEHVTTNCELTGYINRLHGFFDYTVPGSKVVVGMHSSWVNNDRQWKLMVCNYGKK